MQISTDESPPLVASKKGQCHDFEDNSEDCVDEDFIKYAISYKAINQWRS